MANGIDSVGDEAAAVEIDCALERRFPGSSDAITRIRGRLAGLAPLREAVLVIGDSASERMAAVRALHELGSTRRDDLGRIDCGAWNPAQGPLRAGAVCLDGVEHLSPAASAFWADAISGAAQRWSKQLTRVFETTGVDEFRVGSTNDPNRIWEQLSRFRIALPPLSERPEDIGPTAESIVDRVAAAMNRRAALSPAASELLHGYAWPGGVQQLERLLERAIAFTRGESIDPGLIAELLSEREDGLSTIRRGRVKAERDDLLQALRETGGNVTRTAARLGRSRGAVYRLMDKHQVARPDATRRLFVPGR